MTVIAASTPSAYWFLTRGSGVVALILLTLSVALGVATVRRPRTGRVPRFVVNAVHRSASLLAIVFLGVHVSTLMLDGYVPIRVVDLVLPFGASYQPFWVGLGAVAFDLLIAVAVTSVLRNRIGYRAWRATHWLAYACWPVALAHGLGSGSDAGTIWMRAITAACVAVVLVAVVARIRAAEGSKRDVDWWRRASDVPGVRRRARDQHQTAAASRVNPAGKAIAPDRQPLAVHAATVPLAEGVHVDRHHPLGRRHRTADA
jgi:sulfoxide reductase heme-binding subunit YedZ